MASIEFFDCEEYVGVGQMAPKKSDQKSNANRLNELAAVDFSFSMDEEEIAVAA